MKKKDIIIIAAVLLAALALFGVSQMAGGKAASTVVVTVDGEEVLRRPLAMSDTYEIRQDDGSVNVIAVENGLPKARKPLSPLPTKWWRAFNEAI